VLKFWCFLQESLGKFVRATTGFNKKSYGEIQFQGFGSRSTYSAVSSFQGKPDVIAFL